jgi:hypothetical protein
VNMKSANEYGLSLTAGTVNGTTSNPPNVSATGTYSVATSTADSNYWTYVFTGTGSLNFTTLSTALDINVLAVAGGGAGGTTMGRSEYATGGGGGGGVVSRAFTLPSGTTESIAISIGSGGTTQYSANNGQGLPGGNTTLTYTSRTALNATATGGGGGGGAVFAYVGQSNGANGGSGGGGGSFVGGSVFSTGGSAVGTTFNSGNNGYTGQNTSSLKIPGGGGGAAVAATNINGGAGLNSTLPGMVQSWYFGAGGGGGLGSGTGTIVGSGGLGGGGGGAEGGTGGTSSYLNRTGNNGASTLSSTGTSKGGNAATNSGSGGGGSRSGYYGDTDVGNGGTGIVIVTISKSSVGTAT